MLREARGRAWLLIAELARVARAAAIVRAAKACGCDNCRLIYDEEYRTQKMREALARAVRMRTEAARASQRAPGRRQ